MAENRQARPFGLRDKVGYLFGDFGNDFTFILSTMILMKFYTDVVGVSASVVGTIMMVARFVDAFTDVTMGRICDLSRPVPGVGKFRPWIRRMCVPVAVASFLMYPSMLGAWPQWAKVTYLLVTYILWGSVFYTSINIPYGSMASAISPDAGDRQSLSTFRSVGATLAGLIVGALLPVLAYQRVGESEVLIGSRVTLAAGVFSLLAIGCYLLCYALTTERVVPEAKAQQERVSTLTTLRNALHNRALISVIVASIVMLLAQLTMQNMSGYVYPDYYSNSRAQAVSSVLMTVGILIAAALAKPLAARFGKAEISTVSSAFAGVVNVATYFLQPQNVWVFVGLQTLSWFGLGLFTMVSWALITDVIDYAELQNGVREDGSVYALYSFARKLGQAASAGLSGWLLTAIGYVSGAAGGQSAEVLGGIFAISTLVPALGFFLLAIVLGFWYPLHKRQVDENILLLKQKHGESVTD